MIFKPIFGTSKDVRGEGMNEVGVSCIADFDVSPFSDFVEDRASFLLGAIEEQFKSLKRKERKGCMRENQKL